MKYHNSTSGQVPERGNYSHAVEVARGARLFFFAGQTGNDPSVKNEPVVEGGVGPQTTQALENILALIAELGGNAGNIVNLQVILKGSNMDFASNRNREHKESADAMNEAYVAFFKKHGFSKGHPSGRDLPSRTMSWVSEIPTAYENTLVEITAVVAIPVE